MPTRVEKWFRRMSRRPTLERDGAWLLKFISGDTRVWINEINKRKRARRERLVSGHWCIEAELIEDQWKVVDE